MKSFNIYLCGVGGQGIGVLSEVLGQACLTAGHKIKACDTHGLAQRGGSVVSHLRLGDGIFTPKVQENEADLVLGLERFEAYQASIKMLKKGGSVLFYDAQYQPLDVRMGQADYPTLDNFRALAKEKKLTWEGIAFDDIKDPRMQNVALLAKIAAQKAIEGVSTQIMKTALASTLSAAALEANMNLFERVIREHTN